jgi:hypothetical protein
MSTVIIAPYVLKERVSPPYFSILLAADPSGLLL